MTPSDLLGPIHSAILRDRLASTDFDLDPQGPPPTPGLFEPASVLVALIERQQGLNVILTKRSSALQHHPGQIAFPGGRRDATDPDEVFTALREAHEEIGLEPSNVTVLGQLATHETVTGYRMTPVIGHVIADFQPVAQPSEVAEIFEVPLAHLSDPANFWTQSRRWRGQARYYYAVPYGPYYIWGATARILRGLADRMTG